MLVNSKETTYYLDKQDSVSKELLLTIVKCKNRKENLIEQ